MAAQKTHDETQIAAAAFPRLVDEYLSDLHSRHPRLAAASGLHAWDSELEDFSSSAVASEIAAIKKFQLRLSKVPKLELSFSDLMDYQIIASNMSARLLELEEVKTHRRNPQFYSEVISTNLLQQAAFEYASAETRLRRIVAKELKIPALLESAEANIERIPAIFKKISLDSFRGTLNFVEKDLPSIFGTTGDAKLQTDFKKSTRVAGRAIASYLKSLEKMTPDPEASFALGQANLELKLRFEEGIELSADSLANIAHRELSKTQQQFKRAVTELDSSRDFLAVWAKIQKDHPRSGTLVDETRKQMETVIAFLKASEIVTLPEQPAPIVSETPAFFRWAVASMWSAGPFESVQLPSRYLITDVDPSWNDQQKEEYLSTLNFGQLWTTTIHEAYPGHFVQGALLKSVKSQVRKTWALAPATFVEGWAHYAEQMMIEQGFGLQDPRIKLGMLADALLRLCRFVVAIRQHSDGMTIDQATTFFMENAYIGYTPARNEAERGAFDPGYVSYALGKIAILKMREDYKRYRTDAYSLQEFHDRLLSNGLAPIWVHRQILMPGQKGRLLE